ncbi:MAG: pentapeptide repeat-containing protein [Acidimicrobiales bacterium]
MTMADVDSPDLPWPRCTVPGCSGARSSLRACLAHLEGDERSAAMAALGRGRPLDVRGVTIGRELLDEIIGVIPRDDCGRPVLNRARFDRATFEGGAPFPQVVFAKEASFDRARFEGDATFTGTQFAGNARFARAAFAGQAVFGDAVFTGQAWFGGATFGRLAAFDGTRFSNMAWFGSADFATDAEFAGATFLGDTNFDGAAFGCHTVFADVDFRGETRLERATFVHDPSYRGATFTGKGGAPQGAVRQTMLSGPSLASWKQRALARLYDEAHGLAIVAGATVLGLALQTLLHYEGAFPVFAGLGAVAALGLQVRNLVVQGHTGQTPGKRRQGICVVRERDGLPIGPGRSVLRYALHILDTLPALLGWLRPLRNAKGQTFADTVLTTVVVRRSAWAKVGATAQRARAEAAEAEKAPGGG